MSNPSPLMYINKLNLKLVKNFDCHICKICKFNLNSLSPQQITDCENGKNDGTKNTIVVGTCGDIYHRDCIEKLIKGNTIMCPSDNSVWKTNNIITLDSSDSWGVTS